MLHLHSQTADVSYTYDGTESTTANITIAVIGINETPTAQNDEGVIYEGDTLIVANNSDANVSMMQVVSTPVMSSIQVLALILTQMSIQTIH